MSKDNLDPKVHSLLLKAYQLGLKHALEMLTDSIEIAERKIGDENPMDVILDLSRRDYN